MAATISTTKTTASVESLPPNENVPRAVNMPIVNSSESPGRIENRPHSAKMMNATPHRAQGPRGSMITAGSSHEGRSSGVRASVVRRGTGLRVPLAAVSSLSGDGAVAPGDAPYEDYAVSVGVGPHPEPWPTDERYDPELLAHGDRRNVIDQYRYWTVDAIVADLDTRRAPLHVAIQNWEHDFNIGSIVRTANAFNVSGVHILGRRRWNKRGALVTDRYLRVYHHASVADMAAWFGERGIPIVGVDNLPGARGAGDHHAARVGLPAVRLRRARAHRRGGGRVRLPGLHRAVRLHPVHQRRRRRGDRDVRMGPGPHPYRLT